MSAFQLKGLRTKNATLCRHFGGYTTFIRLLVQILRYLENQQFWANFEHFLKREIWSARTKKLPFWGFLRSEWLWNGDKMSYQQILGMLRSFKKKKILML